MLRSCKDLSATCFPFYFLFVLFCLLRLLNAMRREGVNWNYFGMLNLFLKEFEMNVTVNFIKL